MRESDLFLLLGALAALLLLLVIYRLRYRVATVVQCPRCKKPNSLSDFTCSNCRTKGSTIGRVARWQGGKSVDFRCSQCERFALHYMSCTNCKTDLYGVFMRKSGG